MGFGRSARRLSAALVAVAALSACAGGRDAGRFTSNFFNPQEIPLETYTPEQIFERGEFELNRKRPEDGAFYFSEIERLYPYSE